MTHLTRPGTWLGLLALVLAMSGSAYAASKITGAQIKDGTITGKDIKNDTIGVSDVSQGLLDAVAGEPGPAGPQGIQGVPGPAGPSAVSRVVEVEAKISVAPNDTSYVIAYCPAGMSAITGGFTAIMGGGSEVWSNERTLSGTGWVAHAWNYSDYTYGDLTVSAYCAPTGGAVAASAGRKERDRAAEQRRSQKAIAVMACKSATIGGKQKCLQRGQFCAKAYKSQYRKYGFTCGANGRLS